MSFDPSRQQGIWRQGLGPYKDPHITVVDEELPATPGETARGKARRRRTIGVVLFLILLALLAAFIIFRVTVM